MKTYNYIISGAGASGLMLAYRMANDSFFDNTSILIIDKDDNKGNDRTWCFWEKGKGEWDEILYKSWDTIYFGSHSFRKTIDILPYRYKMIRSIQFYSKLWDVIDTKTNIEFVKASILGHKIEDSKVHVRTHSQVFSGDLLFNSIPDSIFLKQISCITTAFFRLVCKN